MSLRIAWGGPWNDRCAIARSSASIVDELISRGNAIEILRTEVGQAALLPSLPRTIPVRFWADVDVYQLARQVDIVIVNFGDHYAHHGAMLDNVDLIGAVGIFHDTVLARLAVDWACSSPFADAALRRVVHATYGSASWKRSQPFLTDPQKLARTRPMLEWFASGVCGAAVPSSQQAQRLRGACPGPIRAIPPIGPTMSAAAYGEELQALLDLALANRPTMMAGLGLGRNLARVTGLSGGDRATERIGMTLRNLVGSGSAPS